MKVEACSVDGFVCENQFFLTFHSYTFHSSTFFGAKKKPTLPHESVGFYVEGRHTLYFR